MMKMCSFELDTWFRSRCVEPQQRLHAGRGVGWVFHRFPIRGGIRPIDVMARNVYKTTPLLSALLKH